MREVLKERLIWLPASHFVFKPAKYLSKSRVSMWQLRLFVVPSVLEFGRARNSRPSRRACGADVAHQLLADETIYGIFQREFPRIIHTFDDYHGLRTSAPERGVMRKFVFRTLFRVQRT